MGNFFFILSIPSLTSSSSTTILHLQNMCSLGGPVTFALGGSGSEKF
jgi:hypothetical protein